MLEKPNLHDRKIITCLQDSYGLEISSLSFLPLGADLNTAVYKAYTLDNQAYYVKLRRAGFFDEAAVRIPKYLSEHGISRIIPSIMTQNGRDWADIGSFHLILYPFIDGKNGFEVDLSDQQRIDFGETLKQLHTVRIPAKFTDHISRETLSPKWRNMVRQFLEQVQQESFHDPIARQLAKFLNEETHAVTRLVRRTEKLASLLDKSLPPFVLCHADIHAWNLLIEPNGRLYVVDWDTLIFAPKERDLMFIGSGLGGRGHTRDEEIALFYEGYGSVQINQTCIAYYRYERIIEDIALYCEQIFLSSDGDKDRVQALEYLKSNFLPSGTIEIAMQFDSRSSSTAE